jgi:hypothetical protein
MILSGNMRLSKKKGTADDQKNYPREIKKAKKNNMLWQGQSTYHIVSKFQASLNELD